MSERKNIDRLFQEKFRDFEVTPDEKVWENIEEALKEKKKRRIIPIWWKFAGVAALLMIGLLVFNRFSGVGSGAENGVVNTDSSTDGSQNQNASQDNNPNNGAENTPSDSQGSEILNPDGTTPDGSASGNKNLRTPNASNNAVAISPQAVGSQNQISNEKEDIIDQKRFNNHQSSGTRKNTAPQNSEGAIAAATDKSKAGKSSSDQPPALQNQKIAANESNSNQGILPANGLNETPTTRQNNQISQDKLEVQSQSTGIAANNAEIKKDSAAIATVEPNALEELLNEKENSVTSREQKINRWQITSNVAPIYFSSVSKGSPLDSRFESNKKSYAPSLSYGVGAKYAINKKFSIKSGVNAVSLEYNTNDIVFFQTENARMMDNVKPNMAGAFVQIESKPENNAISTLGRTRNQYNGEVNQKIGYVEVPVEMSYQLIDKKFGMEVIGGLSTLVLNRNEVSLVSDGLDMGIGEADNLNPVHFSTNVGMGFRYSFLKSFQANVEPMVKYQINTFSNDSGNFKPFFFGIYTGISYKF